MQKKLYRNTDSKIIAGVCSGIAEYDTVLRRRRKRHPCLHHRGDHYARKTQLITQIAIFCRIFPM